MIRPKDTRLALAAIVFVLVAAHATQALAVRQADPLGHVHGVTLRDRVANEARRLAPLAVDDLTWGGGSVMHSNRTHAIYWDPGATIPSGYSAAVNGFLANVAADSGKPTNVYAVAAQYSDGSGAAAYNSTFAGGLTDTDAYPANGCTPVAPRTVCLTDSQLEAELGAYITRNHLPTGLGDIYFVLTPQSVDSCFDSTGSQCSSNYYCAYHSYFTVGGQPVLYADDPYPDGGCWLDQYPNQPGTAADEAINTLSHEHNETITDPELDAWTDSTGQEIGDKCNTAYGQVLGGAPGAGYDQEIGGGKYYLQEEWSNADSGCAAAMHSPPVASMVVSPAAVVPGQAVTVDASGSTGAIASYAVSFGDGSSGSGAVETHSYSAPGVYTVTLTVTAGDGESATTTRSVTVAAPPDRPPSCTSTSATVAAGGAVAIGLACSDPDGGDAIARAVAAGPSHGSLGAVDQASGTVTYRPAPGFVGTDSFAFRATDSHGAASQAAQVTVVVAPGVHDSAVPPLLTAVRLTRAVLKLGPHGPSPRVRVSYTVVQPGTTTFFVERAATGVRHAGRCQRPPAHRTRHGSRCRLWLRLRGSATRQDGQGTTSVRLAAILRHFALRPGDYRLVVVFRTAGGDSQQVSIRFSVRR